MLRLVSGAALAGLGTLAGCSSGSNPYDESSEPWVNFRIGGDRGTARKAKFGSGRGWHR